MNDGFLYKLGESKAEQSEKNFTKIHNPTYFAIAKELSPAGCHLYTALSTYAYSTKVIAYPKTKTLAKRLGVSEKTIGRWTRELEKAKVLRRVPQYHIDGAQTANVIVFNAEYPAIPKNWDTFAPNGFVSVGGNPMLSEEYEELQRVLERNRKSTGNKPSTILGGALESPCQDQGGYGQGPDNLDAAPPLFCPGGKSGQAATNTRAIGDFSFGEEDNLNKKIIKVVVVEERLSQLFQMKTGETITPEKMRMLLDRHGEGAIRNAIDIIMTKSQWPQGAEAALVAGLRDSWKMPKPRSNPHKLIQGSNNAREDKYSAFYKLFPDA